MPQSLLRTKSTAEILILLVGFTVCGYVIVTSMVVLALALFTDRDANGLGGSISDIINTMIGLLAGFLAGRTDIMNKSRELPPDA